MTDAAHDGYELPEGFRNNHKLDAIRNAPSALERVRQIVRILHEPGGCPWDGEQTNASLVKPLLEETYEYIDALETGDRDNMREELGDMLLQSVFQAQICSEDPDDPFTLDEVCDRLVDKLITRHPHIFTDDAPTEELTGEETLALWERMKQKEKRRDSVLDGISNAQGALPRASKVASRVRKSNDTDHLETAFTLPDAVNDGERYADAMLDIIRQADASGVDLENALRNRLRSVERLIYDLESSSSSLTPATTSREWNKLLEAAYAVRDPRTVSDHVEAGGVAAAIETASGHIYTGVCVDTACTLGICAERNAIFHMLTEGEQDIRRVVAVGGHGVMAPCGACRELMAQLMPGRYRSVEILLDADTGRVATLGDLTPDWWL